MYVFESGGSRKEKKKRNDKGAGKRMKEYLPSTKIHIPTFDFQLGLLKMRNPREAKGKIKSKGDNTKEEKSHQELLTHGATGRIYIRENSLLIGICFCLLFRTI